MLACSLEEHDTSATPVGSLLLVVFNSILEVFLLCLAGYILAGRGILDKKTQKQLNRLNVSLFTPALLFSKVAFFLTPEKLKELWVIPIFFVLVTLLSGGIAYILGWVFKLKRSQTSFAMAAAMFMNSNSLPIALMQSLVLTVPDLKWDEGDNKNTMLGRALTYLVMYSTLGMVLRWSYGVRLLSQADTEVSTVQLPDERTPLLNGFNHVDDIDSQPSPARSIDDEEERMPAMVPQIGSNGLRPVPRRRTTFYNSFPNSPNQSRAHLERLDSLSSSSNLSSDELSTPQQQLRSTVSRFKKRFLRAWIAFNDFMTVPLWAALASLLVACLPSFQNWLQFNAHPIDGAISSAGKCSIPVTLVVLGAYFYPNPPEHGSDVKPLEPAVDVIAPPNTVSTNGSATTLIGTVKGLFGKRRKSQGESPKKGETKTVVIAILSRMILTPLLLTPLLVLSAKYDYHAVFEDPVFVMANVLLVASPPALTLAQITQAASGDAFERLISRTIFWSYCIITPLTTILFVLFGLLLTKI